MTFAPGRSFPLKRAGRLPRERLDQIAAVLAPLGFGFRPQAQSTMNVLRVIRGAYEGRYGDDVADEIAKLVDLSLLELEGEPLPPKRNQIERAGLGDLKLGEQRVIDLPDDIPPASLRAALAQRYGRQSLVTRLLGKQLTVLRTH
jgi:hypothetical protein